MFPKSKIALRDSMAAKIQALRFCADGEAFIDYVLDSYGPMNISKENGLQFECLISLRKTAFGLALFDELMAAYRLAGWQTELVFAVDGTLLEISFK